MTLNNFHRISISFMMIFCACAENKKTTQRYPIFNLDSLLNEQVLFLNFSDSIVNKTMIEKTDTQSRKILITDWKKELHPFMEIGIQKPAWRDAFERVSSLISTGKLTSYLLRPGNEKIPVKEFNLYYSENNLIEKIIILKKVNNIVYENNQEWVMEFRNGKLWKYVISGYQKLFFGKENCFRVEVEI